MDREAEGGEREGQREGGEPPEGEEEEEDCIHVIAASLGSRGHTSEWPQKAVCTVS